MTPALQTKYVFTITANIGSVTSVGDIGHGVRRIIPITGGEVRGADINGKVCAFGADFQIIRPNELIELEAKYAIETDDGAVIYVENRGIRFGPVELLQRLKQFDGAKTNAPVLDIDHRAVVGLNRVFRFEFDQLVGPDNLKVRSERADLAVDISAAHLATGNRNDPAHAVTDIADGCHAADIGRDGENISGLKRRCHGSPQPSRFRARKSSEPSCV